MHGEKVDADVARGTLDRTASPSRCDLLGGLSCQGRTNQVLRPWNVGFDLSRSLPGTPKPSGRPPLLKSAMVKFDGHLRVNDCSQRGCNAQPRATPRPKGASRWINHGTPYKHTSAASPRTNFRSS